LDYLLLFKIFEINESFTNNSSLFILSKIMEKKMSDTENITKRVEFSQSDYKELKKIVIELDLDDDGKVTPNMIGQAISHILEKSKQVVSV